MYKCRLCARQFRSGGAVGGGHYSPEVIGAAISSFYTGYSLRQFVEEMKKRDMKGIASLSPDTVGRWVVDHTQYALRLTAGLKFGGSHFCNFFSVASPIRNGHQWWAIFAYSLSCRYILACHATAECNEKVVADFMRSLTRVLDMTERPSFFVVGKDSIYADVLDGLGLSPNLLPMGGSTHPEDWGVLDWQEGNMMQQTQRAFRMKSPERAALHPKGWALSYNSANDEAVERHNMSLKKLRHHMKPRDLEILRIPRVQIPTWTDVVRISARNE